ncbi:MAG: RNA polymerase sigma-70 factor [Bacteroidales bacterium]
MNIRETSRLNKVKSSDVKAFEELFHQFYPGMCSYAESLVNQSSVAEEIVQDVFYNIWKNRYELKIHSSWQSYLFRSVFNNSMMHLRRSRREQPLDEQWAESQLTATEQPSEEMDAKELNAVLIYTLQGLPDRTQEIFKLSRFEGMKYREIAEKLSVSVKTVESNMGKALRALRSSIDQFSKTA